MNKKECLEQIESFATELLLNDAVCELCYHNVDHTRRVVQNADYIAKFEELDEDQMFIIKAVAWFHDLGYSKSYNGHEDASIDIAQEFLRPLGVSEAIINRIVSGINATRVPQEPKNKVEEIIADADLFDLGTDDYFELSEKLFNEWDDCIKPSRKRKQWLHSLDFMKAHKYFTPYGKDVLELKKQQNIVMLEQRLADKIY